MFAKTIFFFVATGGVAWLISTWLHRRFRRSYLKRRVRFMNFLRTWALAFAGVVAMGSIYYHMHLKDYLFVYYGSKNGKDLRFLYNCYPTDDFCKDCITKKMAGLEVFKVTGYRRTDFPIVKGQVITLKPSEDSKLYAGNFLTLFLGPFETIGRKSGILYVPLSDYNQLREFPHAALLYRTSPRKPWACVKDGVTFIADSNGALEFNINDRILEDNRFHFCVTATHGENFSQD